MNHLELLASKSVLTERGCFEHLHAPVPGGYRQVTVDGRKRYVHRVAWETHYGPVPDGLELMHKCDNPPCWNEAHLALATPKQNVADSAQKGRRACLHGERGSNARLTLEQVREIRVRLQNGEKQTHLARELGVTQAALSAIWRGINWRHDA